MKFRRCIIAAGFLLMFSGLLHSLVWLVTGESWDGPLSIRKPILFGISTGMTLISLGWVLHKIRPGKYDAIINPLFAIAMLIEVGLISTQYWRGHASHFNHATPLDDTIDQVMTYLILFAAFVIFDLTRRSYSFLWVSKEMQLAIRSGMAFLSISCGLGFFVLFYGENLARLSQAPEKFGKAGVLKFPHGVVIHALQFLPMLVWGMKRLKIRPQKRYQLLVFAIAAMTTFLAFSLLQTFTGRARFELGLTGGITLLFCLLLTLPIIKELVVASLSQVCRKKQQQLESV
jgi:hypothetical protein